MITLKTPADWRELVDRLNIGQAVRGLALACDLPEYFPGQGGCCGVDAVRGRLVLNLPDHAEYLRGCFAEERLRLALESVMGVPLRLEIRVEREAAVCRNCTGQGWEPTVSGERVPCSACSGADRPMPIGAAWSNGRGCAGVASSQHDEGNGHDRKWRNAK